MDYNHINNTRTACKGKRETSTELAGVECVQKMACEKPKELQPGTDKPETEPGATPQQARVEV